MKRLVLKSDEHRYAEDVARIVRVFAERGYVITEHDAELAWETYSETFCASWLFLPDTDYGVFTALEDLFEEIEE